MLLGVSGWGKPGAAPSRNSVGAPGRLVAGVASITPFGRTLRTHVLRPRLNPQFALCFTTAITRRGHIPPAPSAFCFETASVSFLPRKLLEAFQPPPDPPSS